MDTTVLRIPSRGRHMGLWSSVIVRLGAAAFGVALVVMAGVVAAARVLPTAGEVAFYSNRDGNLNIYRADVGTGVQVALTDSPEDDLSPAWSPDGSTLAFMSYRDGNAELYLMDANGGHLRRLTHNTFNDFGPVWSPDGKTIAFQSFRERNQNIYIVDIESGQERRVTFRNGSYSVKPTWSPDSTRMAFYADDRRDPELYMAYITEGGIIQLTSNTVNDWDPVWSPGGQWLTFYANPDANIDLYLVGSEGGDAQRLTYHMSRDWLPVWSPNSQRLAFLSERSGATEVYVMDTACITLDAGCSDSAVGLGAPTSTEEVPAWSPDSQRLAFASAQDGDLDLYIVDVGCAQAGSGCGQDRARRLTDNAALDRGAVWRP